jgi:predicted RNA methylase
MTSRIQYNNPNANQALSLPYHLEMLSDARRVTPFKQAISATCEGMRVLESGTGSGIMSILAARAGAQKVYAVEIDPTIAQFARENIRRAGLDAVITLIQADVKSIGLEDIGHAPVDVVIAENLSTWAVTEPQIQVMNHISQNLLRTDGIAIPSIIFNCLELVRSRYEFEDAITLRTHYFGFTGIPKPEVLSPAACFQKIDLTAPNAEKVNKTVQIRATADGIVNSVRLTSPLKIHEEISFTASDSLMPPVVFPFEEDISVSIGDMIEVHIEYDHNTSWETFRCAARKV